MGQEILRDYQRLANLLRSQKEALQKDETDRLAALLPLIEEYSHRMVPQEGSQERHPPEAAALIGEIFQLTQENQRNYLRRKARLEEMQAQLQSASRYLQQVRRNHPSPARRTAWTG